MTGKNIFKSKRIILFFILTVGGFYLFLTYPYFIEFLKLESLTGSRIKYTLDEEAAGAIAIKPASARFGLTVLEIGLNKPITEGVDFYDPKKLNPALRQGLAHVLNSSVPGRFGKVVIVGHPLRDIFNFNRFNPEFYLIGRLKVDDVITLFYQNKRFEYRVVSKKQASPSYLDFFDSGQGRGLVLVSGFPPGTAIRFLVVEAEEIR